MKNEPLLPPSKEQSEALATSFIIAEDWSKRFSESTAVLCGVEAELDAEQDPKRVVDLVETKQKALFRAIGSGALSLLRQDALFEQAAFEQEFGDK